MKKRWKVRWAERILLNEEKNKKLKEEKAQEKEEELNKIINVHNNKLKEFLNKYINSFVKEFSKENPSKFEVGEIVTLNWYAKPNTWEGNIKCNFSYLHEEIGPAEVVIKDKWVDESYFYEYIITKSAENIFGTLTNESSYEEFAEKVDKLRIYNSPDEGLMYIPAISWIGWEYSFRFLNPKYKSPKWALRESNFIAKNEPIRKIIKKLWKYKKYLSKIKEKIDTYSQEIDDYNIKLESSEHNISKICANKYMEEKRINIVYSGINYSQNIYF